MASSRRLIAMMAGIGKLKASKKDPDHLYLELGFGNKNGKFYGYFGLRAIPTESVEMVIKDWLTPAYVAAMNGDNDPYTHIWIDPEHLRIALDLCYKELARRANLIHK